MISLFYVQDELITVKLREAEANLSLKEMKARVQDLEETWDRHQEKQREWESNGKVIFMQITMSRPIHRHQEKRKSLIENF